MSRMVFVFFVCLAVGCVPRLEAVRPTEVAEVVFVPTETVATLAPAPAPTVIQTVVPQVNPFEPKSAAWFAWEEYWQMLARVDAEMKETRGRGLKRSEQMQIWVGAQIRNGVYATEWTGQDNREFVESDSRNDHESD